VRKGKGEPPCLLASVRWGPRRAVLREGRKAGTCRLLLLATGKVPVPSDMLTLSANCDELR